MHKSVHQCKQALGAFHLTTSQNKTVLTVSASRTVRIYLDYKYQYFYHQQAYPPMDTDDFTLGLMMDCWVKIIYVEPEITHHITDPLQRSGAHSITSYLFGWLALDCYWQRHTCS